MSVTVVVGGQWGDEGKGRIVDYMAEKSDMVIRFQGGGNAGHTVINEYGKNVLHIVPSGVFRPDCVNIVGAGCVVDIEGLIKELEGLEAAGVDTSNVFIDSRAHVTFPTHKLLDGMQDGKSGIGTTKKGVGPTYTDKAARIGVRMGDLLDPTVKDKIVKLLDQHVTLLGTCETYAPYTWPSLAPLLLVWLDRLGRHRIVDTLPMVRDAYKARKEILLEGQLGVMRDLDWGTYPYVTSSNPTAAAAAVGSGLPATAVDKVVVVVKAYTTAVGAGPFPTELEDEVGETLRAKGGEYGATTGRPRRCGWFDVPAARLACWLNGATHLAITKIDVLDGFEKVGVGANYIVDTSVDLPPANLESVKSVWVDYLPGWSEKTTECRKWDDLPPQAQDLCRLIESELETPIRFVSVGPERDQLIEMEEPEPWWVDQVHVPNEYQNCSVCGQVLEHPLKDPIECSGCGAQMAREDNARWNRGQ